MKQPGPRSGQLVCRGIGQIFRSQVPLGDPSTVLNNTKYVPLLVLSPAKGDGLPQILECNCKS